MYWPFSRGFRPANPRSAAHQRRRRGYVSAAVAPGHDAHELEPSGTVLHSERSARVSLKHNEKPVINCRHVKCPFDSFRDAESVTVQFIVRCCYCSKSMVFGLVQYGGAYSTLVRGLTCDHVVTG